MPTEEIDVEQLMRAADGAPAGPETPPEREAREALLQMKETEDIANAPLMAHVPFGCALALGVKRLLRKLLATSLRQQTAHNQAATRLAANQEERIRKLEAELERLRAGRPAP